MKKKVLSILLVFVMGMMCFSACTSPQSADNTKIQIVCTIFPIYDWVREITAGSENVEVTLLVSNGSDLHNYQPSVEDIAKITKADLFFYVGGESDFWVSDVCSEPANKNLKAFSLMEMLGEKVKEEEIVEGMEAEEEHVHEAEGEDHDHEGEGEERDHEDEVHVNEEEGPEYDEHIWLSLKNAGLLCESICNEITTVDTKNTDLYKNNLATYGQKLTELDEQYRTMVDGSVRNAVVFADRFPFRYLVDDYNLSYYAAFVGCSAETEASFNTITFLAQKADELDAPVILVIESSDQKIAKTVVENTQSRNQEILVLGSLQSVMENELNSTSYLGVMQDNLEVLKKALQ